MRHRTGGWLGIRSWVFWRHFWQHRRENLFIIAILTLGFLFYTVYGAWTSSVSSSEAVRVEPVRLPCDVLVRVPAWTEQVTTPDTDPSPLFTGDALTAAMRAHPLFQVIPPAYRPENVPSPVQALVRALAVPVMTTGGTVETWGVEAWDKPLHDAFRLVDGRWPQAHHEAVVHSRFARRTGVDPGATLTLMYIPPDKLLEERTRVTIVGVFDGEYDVTPEILLPLPSLQKLAHLTRPNVYLAWSEFIPDHVVETGPPANETLRWPLPQLEDLLGSGLEAVRLPTIGRLPPREYHPLASQAQFLLPFGLTVDDDIYINGSPGTEVHALYRGITIKVSAITLLIFLSQGIAVTVVLAIVVVDRQRLLGTYKVLGLSSRQLRWVYFLQVAVVGLGATMLGGFVFWLLPQRN